MLRCEITTRTHPFETPAMSDKRPDEVALGIARRDQRCSYVCTSCRFENPLKNEESAPAGGDRRLRHQPRGHPRRHGRLVPNLCREKETSLKTLTALLELSCKERCWIQRTSSALHGSPFSVRLFRRWAAFLHWLQIFKSKYLHFHFDFAEGQSIKISQKYQNPFFN